MKQRPLAVIAILLAAALAGGQEAEKPEGWVCGGPWGGLVFNLRTDPARVGLTVAQAPGGSFLSTGKPGGRWRRIESPGEPWWGPVFLGGGRLRCASGGRALSSADGTAWHQEGAFPGRMTAVGAAGADGRVLAGGVATAGDREVGLFVARLSDGAWERIEEIIVEHPRPEDADPSFAALLTHPKRPAEIRYFVQLSSAVGEAPRSHLLSSGDGGQTWSAWEIGHAINAVAWDPVNPSVVFAVEIRWEEGDSPLLRSDNGGKSFRRIGTDPRLSKLRTLALAPGGGRLLLGSQMDGLLLADRTGRVLAEIGDGLPEAHVTTLAVDPARPNTVLAGTQVGVFRSEDGGGSFRRSSEGLAGLQVTGLVAPAEGRLLCFGYHEGVRISTDGGRTWEPRPSRLASRILDVRALGPTILVAAKPRGRDLHRASFDGGLTWTPVEVDGEPCGVGAGGKLYARGADTRLRVSRDGKRWKDLDHLSPEPVTMHRAKPDGPILVGRERGVDILDGRTGKRLTTLAVPGRGTLWPEIHPDATLADVVYVGGRDGGLYRLDLSVRKLVRVYHREGVLGGHPVADPALPDWRLLVFGDGHFIESDDAGRTWRALAPAPPFRSVRGLAVSGGRLAVAADGAVHSIDLDELR